MEQNLKSILTIHSPISLCEMDSVQLMNRLDNKYVFHKNSIPILLEKIKLDYQVLDIDGSRIFDYHTTYFDTELLDMYNMHVRGKLNRQKLRIRNYASTGTSFMEIKTKTNKGRTVKKRILLTNSDNNENESDRFIEANLLFSKEKLKPTLTNHFKRITLVSLKSKERLTLDFDLSFENCFEKNELQNIAIAELKQENHSTNSIITNILQDQHIRSTSFSKYCVGSALLNKELKKNILKPQLLLIEKLENRLH